jgi:HPt (histidine-containing phosphotransfer) domain-containing protein
MDLTGFSEYITELCSHLAGSPEIPPIKNRVYPGLSGYNSIECYHHPTTMNLDPDGQPLQIDWERLSQISDDDEEFQLELLNMLAADITEQIVIIGSAIEKQNSKELQELGHYLKGATANVGVESIALIAYQIEEAGRAKQFELAETYLAALSSQQNQLAAYLSTKAAG